MNKIEKFLRSISKTDRDAILLLIDLLERDPAKVPGIMALSGMKDFYRVRMGNYRIIFFRDPKTKKVETKRIGRRNEKTYKDL